jgi:hypothetical protein
MLSLRSPLQKPLLESKSTIRFASHGVMASSGAGIGLADKVLKRRLAQQDVHKRRLPSTLFQPAAKMTTLVSIGSQGEAR